MKQPASGDLARAGMGLPHRVVGWVVGWVIGLVAARPLAAG